MTHGKFYRASPDSLRAASRANLGPVGGQSLEHLSQSPHICYMTNDLGVGACGSAVMLQEDLPKSGKAGTGTKGLQ